MPATRKKILRTALLSIPEISESIEMVVEERELISSVSESPLYIPSSKSPRLIVRGNQYCGVLDRHRLRRLLEQTAHKKAADCRGLGIL